MRAPRPTAPKPKAHAPSRKAAPKPKAHAPSRKAAAKPPASGLPAPVLPPVVASASDPLKTGMVTRAEHAQRLALVDQLMIRGWDRHRVVQAMRERYRCGANYTSRLMEEVRARWAKAMEEDRPSLKARAIRNYRRLLERLQEAEPKDWNWPAIIQIERLLADVEGTREPIKVTVDVQVQQSVARVLSGMNKGQLDELVAEYRETRKLAEQARALATLGDGTEVHAKRAG